MRETRWTEGGWGVQTRRGPLRSQLAATLQSHDMEAKSGLAYPLYRIIWLVSSCRNSTNVKDHKGAGNQDGIPIMGRI